MPSIFSNCPYQFWQISFRPAKKVKLSKTTSQINIERNQWMKLSLRKRVTQVSAWKDPSLSTCLSYVPKRSCTTNRWHETHISYHRNHHYSSVKTSQTMAFPIWICCVCQCRNTENVNTCQSQRLTNPPNHCGHGCCDWCMKERDWWNGKIIMARVFW